MGPTGHNNSGMTFLSRFQMLPESGRKLGNVALFWKSSEFCKLYPGPEIDLREHPVKGRVAAGRQSAYRRGESRDPVDRELAVEQGDLQLVQRIEKVTAPLQGTAPPGERIVHRLEGKQRSDPLGRGGLLG